MQKLNAGVALADDQVLLRNGRANLIHDLEIYAILFEAGYGKDLVQQFRPTWFPRIALLDSKRPEMNGYQTALWLKRNYPGIKILALSWYDNENDVIRIMKGNVGGVILEDVNPIEFRYTLNALIGNGLYYSELITGRLIPASMNLLQATEPQKPSQKSISLNARETEFLKLVCTEMTYKEIAERMYLSARTIDGYRDALFEKLSVRSRVGLVLYAIKNGIVIV